MFLPFTVFFMPPMLLNILFEVDFLPFLLVVFIAWMVPILLNLLQLKRLPAPVVEIIIGFILARYFVGHASEATFFSLDFLGLIGLIFIMFLSGLEIDVDQLLGSFPRKKITLSGFLKNPLLVGLVHYAVTLVLSYLCTWLLSFLVHIPNIWFFSVILTTTFLGLVLPVLKDRGESSGRFGQMLIVGAAVADVLSILLLTVSAITLRFGFSLELLLVISLFILFYIAYRLGKQLHIVLFQRITFQLSHAASQISIRGTMLLLFIFVALSQFMGEEGILLGAFMSGLLLSFFLHKGRSLLLLKLDGMGFGFFIPIFFVMVGVKFDPGSLREFDQSLYLFLGMMALVMFAVKVLPSVIWVRLFGWRRSLAGGFLMSARLGLVIAAASIGLQLNVVTPGLNSSFIIMAILTCFFSPLMYNLINRQSKYLEDKVVIAGGSSVGVLLARRLKMHGRTCIIIEKNEGRYNEIIHKGLQAFHGDATEPETFREIQLNPGNYVVVNTSSDVTNVEICSVLRKDLQHEKIISKPGNSKIESQLRQYGVEILDARRVLATTLENLILRPTTYHALVDSFENYSVEDVTITNPGVDGKQIKEIPFDRDGMLILVTRGNEKDIPRGDTFLKTGDVITVFGTESAVNAIRRQVRG